MSGVILAHPGLTLKIAGYTDSTGSDQFNLKLSGQRADEVRTFLAQQGLSAGSVTSAEWAQPIRWPAMILPWAGNRTGESKSSSPVKPLVPERNLLRAPLS